MKKDYDPKRKHDEIRKLPPKMKEHKDRSDPFMELEMELSELDSDSDLNNDYDIEC